MRALSAILRSGLFLAGFASAFSLFAATRSFEPPRLKAELAGKGAQTLSLRKTADGASLLYFENTTPDAFCQFTIPGGIPLQKFETLVVEVRLDRTLTDPLQNFTIRIRDAKGEIHQYFSESKLPMQGEVLRFTVRRTGKSAGSWGMNTDGKLDQPAMLAGCSFRFRDSIGKLALRGISIEVPEPYKLPPEVTPEVPSDGLAIFDPSARTANLMIVNAYDTPLNATLTFSISDVENGNADRKTVQLKLSPKERRRIPFPLPARYGVYTLTYSIGLQEKSDAPPRQGAFRFACQPPVPSGTQNRDAFLLGICAHELAKLPQDVMEKELAAIAASGAQIVRFSSYWDLLEPRRNSWNFASMDRVFNTLERFRLKAQVLHARQPGWATAADWKSISTTGRKGRPQPDFDAWRTFVGVFAERYRGRIDGTEIWNEPDLYGFADFSTDAYLKLLRLATEEIRRIDPGTRILTAGFATIPSPNWTRGNADIVDRTVTEGRNLYDIFALHSHSPLYGCAELLDLLETLRKKHGDIGPLYLNEAGLSTRHYSETDQARELFRKVLFSRSRGAIAYNWYNLRNSGNDPRNVEHNFGLLQNNFQPKPAYAAYNMLARIYRNTTFKRTMKHNERYTVLSFTTPDGSRLFPFWSNQGKNRKLPVSFSGITGKAVLIDLFGNERELPVREQTVLLEISEQPATLKLTEQKDEALFCGERFRFGENDGLLPDCDNRVELELFNPVPTEQTFHFTFRTSDTLKIIPATGSLRLAARSSGKIEVNVRPSSAHRSAPSDTFRLRLGELQEEEFPLPFEYVRSVSNAAFPAEPDLTLNRFEQVSILVPSDPTYEKLFWKGPEDLSARVFLALANGEFKLRIEVTDDVHSQPYSGGELWRGDSVQFAVMPLRGRGFWRFGIARRNDGGTELFVWDTWRAVDPQSILSQVRVKTSRDAKRHLTIYDIRIPSRPLGLAKEPFRFNLLVNDNDGSLRESFIEFVPGLGRDPNPRLYPLFRQAPDLR